MSVQARNVNRKVMKEPNMACNGNPLQDAYEQIEKLKKAHEETLTQVINCCRVIASPQRDPNEMPPMVKRLKQYAYDRKQSLATLKGK